MHGSLLPLQPRTYDSTLLSVETSSDNLTSDPAKLAPEENVDSKPDLEKQNGPHSTRFGIFSVVPVSSDVKTTEINYEIYYFCGTRRIEWVPTFWKNRGKSGRFVWSRKVGELHCLSGKILDMLQPVTYRPKTLHTYLQSFEHENSRFGCCPQRP